jgi:hypothetical protein
MGKLGWIVLILVVVVGGAWVSRGKAVDFAADEVVKKFSSLSCEQLAAAKNEPPGMVKKVAIGLMHDDAKVREAFIDRVAAPVLNKMIECGLAP